VREAFQVELPLRKLFKTPTVAGLAADILEDEGQRDRIEHTAELLLKLTSLSDKEVDDLLAEKIGSIEEGNAQ
jgi:hypothetical protein